MGSTHDGLAHAGVGSAPTSKRLWAGRVISAVPIVFLVVRRRTGAATIALRRQRRGQLAKTTQPVRELHLTRALALGLEQAR